MKDQADKIVSYLMQTKAIDETKAKEAQNDNETLWSLLIDLFKNHTISLDEIELRLSIDAARFLSNFAKYMGYEYCDLDSCEIDYTISSHIPMEKLKHYEALPIKEDSKSVYIAFKDSSNLNTQKSIQYLFNDKLIKPIVCRPHQIDKYLNKLDLDKNIQELIANIKQELISSENMQDSSSGILKLIHIILKTAILARGSDIHIEPTQKSCIIRTRIDGILSETFVFDKDIYPPLSSRLKLLSNIDIAEKRKPQDGRFSTNVLDKEYDFRVSTLPTIHGESVVLRVLDKSKVMIKLENLGMKKHSLERFKKFLKAPYGIVFVTGPTGSGKTTTLYAALNAIKSVKSKIITIEDPVEYQLSLISQTQVNEKASLSFSSALRSILRQDPDVIMVGEVRDKETLKIALQAALTGHLVFSTLHTNDSVSAITRLTDMGIEPYLISGALVGIEAQRLIRKLCPHCKAPTSISKEMVDDETFDMLKNHQIYRHVGCEKCSQTGYMGREIISEILPISEKISSMIALGLSNKEITQQAKKEGFSDMYSDGLLKVVQGITSIDEVLRVAKS